MKNQGRKKCSPLSAERHSCSASCLVSLKPRFGVKYTYFVLNIYLVFISQEKEKSELGHGTFSWWAQMGGEYVLAHWPEAGG